MPANSSGSILATPLMLYVVGLKPHVAIGTSALVVSANAFVGLGNHARKHHVRWHSAIMFALFGIAGAVIGSTLGKAFDGKKLLFLFAILMIVVGMLMLRRHVDKQPAPLPGDRIGLKKAGRTGTVALAVGALSGFFGIGGGFLIVPGLLFATGMPMIFAIGSSLLSVGTFSLATAVNYAISGQVEWRVALEFILGGVMGGLLGTKLATSLSTSKDVLNRVFAGLVFAVAIYMLYNNAAAVGVHL